MIPKETAISLVEKYKLYADGYEHGEYDHYWDDPLHLANAKACAIIDVQGKIDLLKEIEDNYDDEFLGGYKKHYQEVKKQIELL